MNREESAIARIRLNTELVKAQRESEWLEKEAQTFRVKIRAACMELSSVTDLGHVNNALLAIDEFEAAGGMARFRELISLFHELARRKANIVAALSCLDGE